MEEEGGDPEKHARVTRALDQINDLQYRYHAPPKKAKEELTFDSDSDDGRADRTTSQYASDGEDSTGSGEDAGMSLDDHIEHILRKTRTIALLKIANNTAEIITSADDEIDEDDYSDGFDEELIDDDEEEEDGEDVGGDTYAQEKANDGGGQDSSLRSSSGRSFRKLLSMRQPSAVFLTENSEEAAAAHRLARKLSTYLCLPRMISYRDLEEITEALLNEWHSGPEEYADLIDCHVDSARDSTSAGDADDSTESLFRKHRDTQPTEALEVEDDPNDLELHQRRLFMEANQFGRFSSRNFFAASSKSLLNKASMQRLASNGSLRLSSHGSSRDMSVSHKVLAHSMGGMSGMSSSKLSFKSGAVTEEDEDDDEEGSKEGAVVKPVGGERGSIFQEQEYVKWRTEIKDDYLAWINAKVVAAKLRKERRKKESGKKPRWQLLYEASKRPSSRDAQGAK